MPVADLTLDLCCSKVLLFRSGNVNPKLVDFLGAVSLAFLIIFAPTLETDRPRSSESCKIVSLLTDLLRVVFNLLDFSDGWDNLLENIA